MPTNLVYSSILPREMSLPLGTRKATTRPLGSLAGPANTLNAASFNTSATSINSKGIRKSGLSDAKRRIASA